MYIINNKNNNNSMNKKELKFSILCDDEFDRFARSHPLNNFFQSIYMRDLLVSLNRNVYLVGLKDKSKKIVCATLLTNTGCFLNNYTYEALKGYLIDYSNCELVKLFTDEIIKFIKLLGGFRLIIDPYIMKKQRDSTGKCIENGKDNTYIIKYLNNLGFKEIKNNQVKLTFVLDTNKDFNKTFNQMKPNTRNIINKTINKYKLIVEELPYNKLNIFKNITQDTCLRRNFKDRSLSYYQNMYKSFKDNIKVLICKLDLNLYLNELLSEKESINNKLNTNNEKKKKQLNKELLNINKKINEIEIWKKNNKYIILSGAMFITYGDEVVYLFSGSYEKYMKFNGQYRLQYEMIKYACLNNYKRYNFYGIKSCDDNDGIYEFKKGFNGYVEELLGAYEIGICFTYKVYKLLSSLKKIFKK